jgi:hypothetical protein
VPQLLQQIAVEADRQRLWLLVEELEKSFPEFKQEFQQCALMPDAETVLSHLEGKCGAWLLVRNVPHVHEAITALQRTYQERNPHDIARQLPNTITRRRRRRPQDQT